MSAVGFNLDGILRDLCSCNAIIYETYVAGGDSEIRRAIHAALGWELKSTSDGDISVVENLGIAHDYSANSAYFALHTDGLSYKHPPQFVMLYCENAGTAPVPTFFLDTTQLLERLSKRHPDAYAVLRRLDQVFIAREGVEFRRPLIERNPIDGAEVMNATFGRAYLLPSRDLDGTGDEPHQVETVMAFQKVVQLAEETRLCTHTWSRGDLVVWDNHRFVHGRGDAVGSEGRRLIRAWLSPTSEELPYSVEWQVPRKGECVRAAGQAREAM